ncbi:MAG: carbamoyl-phosphate synthase large subunit [Gammaproteobacteria bacterium]|uniref:Carbamoyl phosphate synthase large chain n=1 Tax=SAR86 cluster bacterium TaxID=2030880 RepID=A0A520MSQ7_9GAMM|nr:MAG: carbamoyl-phosphate synthase large subunit [SAR86 cluster bacterium]|tara:strand:+ start:2732 stop:5932 length:3201 start_codon:yes stop_codon:yes gene_type:complete
MPKREDLKTILIVGSGPIIIGQACEFDYSGTQACKALRENGYRVVLVNSNPATIMTDPEIADATYIEPVDWQSLEKIIEKEKPDAILPTMGGQTGLNVSLELAKRGILEKHSVEMIGANREAIDNAEDREKFDNCMKELGLETPRSGFAHSMEDAWKIYKDIGLPCVIRPSFTMGGTGGGIAYNLKEFEEICMNGLKLSPTKELLIDESLVGWKEFEMEVVRDKNDNCIIVCSIENVDPMGVHTGDSITVAPAQTLTDKEYQEMRDASFKVLRKIGVETGGSNVQFAQDPETGRLVVIEMNPRVSRSSALASKATGFPIAKVAALLAVGYTLDELKNDITDGKTPASFEPTIDYVVTKIPRFNFEKFPETDSRLTTQMKSVGEVMAIGRNFQESFQKAIRSMENGLVGLSSILKENEGNGALKLELSTPGESRLWFIADAFRRGWSMQEIFDSCQVDKWFLHQIREIVNDEKIISESDLSAIDQTTMKSYKKKGFSDARMADLLNIKEQEVRNYRYELDVHPVFKKVDSCAAEFDSTTNYLYSTYDEFNESEVSDKKKVIVLGSGPNRIGQGIEFDYCCVQAALAFREENIETIMINSNPETVSTDFDVSDKLYFEPIVAEDVLEIIRHENPYGVVVQFGGQTPLKLTDEFEKNGVKILGTSPSAIDTAENREKFKSFLSDFNFLQPENRIAQSVEEAYKSVNELSYPVIVRPSYVLGGRAMELIYTDNDLKNYLTKVALISPENPLLIEKFLDDAVELDIDVICDGEKTLIGGVLQHIEEAGIHSGDSSCSFPPYSVGDTQLHTLKKEIKAVAKKLNVVGLMNAQVAIKDDKFYMIEVNPRASRTIPFLSKCIGNSLAKIASKVILGKTLDELGLSAEIMPTNYAVKAPVFPFNKFRKVDPILGPEMKSTGEVMGRGDCFGEAYGKAVKGAGESIPKDGNVFVSVKDNDKKYLPDLCTKLTKLGFKIVATKGTAEALEGTGINVKVINKVLEGRPHIVDAILNNEIDMIINTTEGRQSIKDSFSIRRSALEHNVFFTTTVSGGFAIVESLEKGVENWEYKPLQLS